MNIFDQRKSFFFIIIDYFILKNMKNKADFCENKNIKLYKTKNQKYK